MAEGQMRATQRVNQNSQRASRFNQRVNFLRSQSLTPSLINPSQVLTQPEARSERFQIGVLNKQVRDDSRIEKFFKELRNDYREKKLKMAQ